MCDCAFLDRFDMISLYIRTAVCPGKSFIMPVLMTDGEEADHIDHVQQLLGFTH